MVVSMESVLPLVLVGVLAIACAGVTKPAYAVGIPSRAPNMDVLPGFVSPPPGYDEVPFYWWLGDKLTKDRLTWQLDKLTEIGVTGLQINYAHSDVGGNSWGLTYKSDPPLFSDDWWKLVQWWSGECSKRGISMSLSDYTLGIVGQGYWMDEILAADPTMRGSVLEVSYKEATGGDKVSMDVRENAVCVVAYRSGHNFDEPSSVDLREHVVKGKLTWDVPDGKWRIVTVYPKLVQNSVDPLDPKLGPMVIDRFFGRFDSHLPGQKGKGLNFFFSDELNFGISGKLWSSAFPEEFRKRKGYDIVPLLAGLFTDIGPQTPKIRLDYADVMVAMEEEAYFKPVFKWHNDAGMVYGCDHGGRGYDTTEFGDYFRTQRWMTGPGCDQPGLACDVIKNKVASSIAHLYERPRVWLEGYYGSGWGTNTADLTKATAGNFASGQNLLSLHGLYYSTYGGWWEWAPPCNHFRTPYWAHMSTFADYVRRLSYLMSQGVHKCDIAIIYPVESVQAGMDGQESVNTAFDAGRRIYDQGIDFDFIDHESLARATVGGKALRVSGESYKVLIVPSMKALRHSTVQKALEFYRAGGTVIAVGSLPEASDRAGRDDAELDSMVAEIFQTEATKKDTSTGLGISLDRNDRLAETISESIDRDFIPESGCHIMHRKIGKRDVYMVFGASKGSQCFFACKGKVEIWDPWTGKTKPLMVTSETADGTWVRMPLESYEAQLIVFSPGDPGITIKETNLDDVTAAKSRNGEVVVTGFSTTAGPKRATAMVNGRPIEVSGDAPTVPPSITLDGDWEFELKPTMDNRWGDFRLPATSTFIGPEARKFSYKEESSENPGYQSQDFDDSTWPRVTYDFGPRFWKLGPIKSGVDTSDVEKKLATTDHIDPSVPVVIDSTKYRWQPYVYGLRQGIEGDPGHQGYHGLKGLVSDEFIGLGKREFSATDSHYVAESKDAGSYFLWSTVRSDSASTAKLLIGGMKPAAVWLSGKNVDLSGNKVALSTGNTPLLIRYDGPGRGYLVFDADPTKKSPNYPLSMHWYMKPGILAFDPMPEQKHPAGWYRFTAPPGLKSMTFSAHGVVQAWAAGSQMTISKGKQLKNGAWEYKATVASNNPKAVPVAIRIEQNNGFYGGSAIPEPIALECSGGVAPIGDWSKMGTLESYSGGAWYRKTITLTPEQVASRVTIDLGNVVSSAEIIVNGKQTAVKVSPPWKMDISEYVKPGQNRVEILVYNTLSNHYTTIPTRYRGDLTSGLLGPVKLELAKPVTLKGKI